MLRAMVRRPWWWRGLVYLSVAAMVGGQMAWPLQAAVLTWDADTGTAGAQDGGGTWDTTNSNWWDGAGNVTWNNSTPDSAIFGAGSGAAGTVTVSGTLNVAGITFNAPGSGNYTLSGGTVTLTSPSVVVNADATIGSVLAGTGGLSKSGSGVLTLTGSNTYSGGTTISGGVLAGSSIANQGSNSSFGTGNFTLSNNGTLRYTGGSASTNRTFTLGSGGGQIGITTSGTTLTVSGALSGSGNLTVLGPTSGTGVLILSGNNAGYTGTVRPAANTVVQFNSPSALGGTSIMLQGGTARIYGASSTVQSLGVNGLNAYYYNMGVSGLSSLDTRFATDLLVIPDRVITRVDDHPQTFNLPVAVNTDYPRVPVVGFQVPDRLAMMWKGLLNITTGGTYTFRVAHDDYFSLYIDGQVVLPDSGHTSGGTRSATVNLSAGAHSIVIKFTQGAGGKYLVLDYSGADTGNNYQILGSTPGTLTTGSLAPLPIGAVGGSGTLEIYSDMSAAGFTGSGTFTLTSPTISTLAIDGPATLTANTTLAPTTGALIFNQGISGSYALTVAGPYLTRFNATNTYTGSTTVTGGRLELAASGGNAIPGNLDINASNTTLATLNPYGLVANVQLKASEQIANTASVTVRNNSLLDLGSYQETIATLSLRERGQIWGTGTLTVTNLTGSTFQSGRLLANLAGSGTLNKTTSGTLILAGNNTYTGQTIVQAGVLNIRHGNALGASGGGNDTSVWGGATLELQGGLQTSESITVVGNGHNLGVGGANIYLGALRNISGVNRLDQTLTLNGDTLIRSEGGNLVLANPTSINALWWSNLTIDGSGEVTLKGSVNLSGGTITKLGRGTLTFDQSLSVFPSINSGWTGVIGFNGPQWWGVYSVPTGRALKFYSDPGSGVSIQLNQSAVIAGYAADQNLLSRIDGLNSPNGGALLLAVDSAYPLNFTAHPTLALGAYGAAAAPGGRIRYTGTITPGAGGYLLGAPTGDPTDVLEVGSVLSGSANVGIYGPVYLSAGNRFPGTFFGNTFTGTIQVASGGMLLNVTNNQQLGNSTNLIQLNGGTLHLLMTGRNQDSLFGQLGNRVADGAARQIQVGPAGGTIHVSTPVGALQERFLLSGVNPLTGSGTLTKTGQGYLEILSSSDFSGSLVLASQGGGVELRASGKLPNVSSITLNQNAYFIVDNQNSRSNRQWPSVNDNDRVNDNASITLRGGFLYYRARNASGQTSETFGPTTLGLGHSMLRLEVTGQGADVTISNLIHQVGGTVRFESNTGTQFGTTGNAPRLFFTQINGQASSTTNLIGGWAFISENSAAAYHWAAYNTTSGVIRSTYTNVGATTFTPSADQVINLNASGTATLTDSVSNAHQMLALRFEASGAQTLAFADANDVLYIGSGGILSHNVDYARTIGSSTVRGKITAGAPGASGTQELFFHLNRNTTQVYSIIQDNGSAPVALIKDLGGILNLWVANTYSGGTYLYGGEIGVYATGALGSGPVLVKGPAALLRLNAKGATSNTSGIRAQDGGILYLDNAGVTYNADGDRFIVEAGSGVFGHIHSADRSLNSLTRVSTLTAGGQIILHPGAIIRAHGDGTYAGDIMTYMIKNLGTDADLFFCQGWGQSSSAAVGSSLQSITVGAGTPWKGLASLQGGDGWYRGTIYANSDFWLQGTYSGGASAYLALGRPNTSDQATGSYAILNQAGRPINIFVTGQVVLHEDTPVQMSDDITFVVTHEGYLQPNWANSFGDPERFGTRAKVLVQAGGTLDPGNYTPIYPYPDDTAQYGKQYALPSPVNTDVVVEAGGRFLINDASGAGSTTGGAKWLMKTGSILELGHPNAFFGGYVPGETSNLTGLIPTDQFVFEPYPIIRLGTSDIYKISEYIPTEQVIYEIFGGNRYLTNQINPFIPPAVGTSRYAPETITIRNGVVTNDSVDRRLEEGRGKVILEDGTILAATTQTILYVRDVHIAAGATITIGLPKGVYIDGNPKYGGAVWFDAYNGISAGPGATLIVDDGAQLGLAARNVWPDTIGIHLPYAVTSWTPPEGSSLIPASGSTLMLRTGWFTEVIGPLTGTGGVLTDQDGAWVATGWGTTSDFTFAGVFSGTAGKQPNLEKIGPSTMWLTGTSTSTGEMRVNQGTLALSGSAGKTSFATVRVGKTGTLLLDNSTTALNDRLGGKSVSGQGGILRLVGGSTAVTETIGQLNNGGSPSGSKTFLEVVPGSATTTFVATTIESYASGSKQATWVFRGPTLANQPIVYNADNTYTVPAGNLTNGLIRATNPNFWISSGIDQPGRIPAANQVIGIAGAAGTPVAPTRGDILGDPSYTGQGVGFVTQDVNNDGSVGFRLLTDAEYAPYFWPALRTNLNVRLTGSATAWGNTEFRVLRMAPGSELVITGVVPLTASPSRLVLTAPGILVESGGTATIRGTGTYLDGMGAASGSLYFHTYGDLTLEAPTFTWNSFVKTGPGTLTFAPDTATLWRGTFVLQEGQVVLEPNNSFRPWPSQHRFYFPTLHINGGEFDLGGNSQWIGDLQSVNWLPYGEAAGGVLTSSSPATITMTGGGTFSGQISGPISIVKYSNSTLLLTNENPMTGSLDIRQGVVALRDEGRLPNLTGPINLQYSRLDIDNAYLAARNDRLPDEIDLVMRGGDLVHRGRAGTVTQVRLGTVTLQDGTNLFQTESVANGASETYIQNLVRSTPRSVVVFQQNYGYIGTLGNDTTAIRYLVQNVNGVPTQNALTNKILGGWAVVAANDFATYLPGRGIGALGNTADGFPNYDSTNLLSAAATHNVNDGTARTLTANTTINSLRFNGDVTFNLSTYTLTVQSGGILSNRGGTHGFSGGSLTSGAGALYIFVNQGTMSMGSSITGTIDLVKFGSGTLSLNAANTYTGTTYAFAGTSGASNPSGTLTLNVSGANGTSTVAIPGDLHIHQTTVTEAQPHQISQSATVYLYSHATLNLQAADNVSETLAALKFFHSGGTSEALPIVTRGSQRVTSSLNLTADLAIEAITDNPVSVPAISQNVGTVNFTGSGPQEIYVAGQSPINLIFNAGIGSVPTGGLKKTGPGLLHLGGNVGSTFGNPSTLTDLFFIEEGIVRVDTSAGTASGAVAINNKIGSNKVNTVVRGGAGLLGRNALANPIYGSIRLEDGSFLGTTEGDSVFGQATTDTNSLAQLEVPDGATATIYVRDYYYIYESARTITINSKLTGAGTIEVVGPLRTSTIGVLRLGNNITGTTGGGNDFSGTIVLNPNTRLQAQTTGSATTGNLLGTATIVLQGGELYLRDNGTGSSQTISYGNNVTLSGPSIINADRISANSSNAIQLGTLTVAAGEQILQTPFTGSTFTTVNNSYRIAFTSIAGPGTLVKAGHQPVEINSYDASFSGNFVVAGPIGLTVQPSGNLRLNATTNTINNLTVNGIFSPVGGKTLNVQGVLEVGDNAGQVLNGTYGVSTGSVTGAMSVPSNATVNINILRNNGIIGATGGSTTISANQIQGSGLYQTYNQSLRLQGPSNTPVLLANAPDRPTTIKVAGNNTVILNPASSGTMTGGVEVQSGTLQVAPTSSATNPFGATTIKVLGYGTPTVASGPVRATLQLSASSGAITHGGDIQNSGLVQVTGGSVTVAGTIAGPGPNAWVPGLLESFTTASGVWNSSSPQGTGNFGVKLEPRMGNMNVVTQDPITGWGDNHTWTYSGLFYDADGYFSFLENIDDNAYILIDGTPYLSNTQWNHLTSTSMKVGQRDNTIAANSNTASGAGTLYFGMGPNGDGWHTIEIRFNNGGGGGAGPYGTVNSMHNNFGFGLNVDGTRALDGAVYTRPIDPGNGTLFRTPILDKGFIQIDDGASLTAGQITQMARLTLASATSSLSVQTASDVDQLLAQAGTAQLNGPAPLTVNTTLSSETGDFTKAGTGTLILASGGTNDYTGDTTVLAGKLLIDGVLTSNVTVTGGHLGGTGTIQGNVVLQSGTASASAGNLADSTGMLTILGNYTHLGTMQIDIQGPQQGTTYDWISATGNADVQGTLRIVLDGYQPPSLATFDVLTAPTIQQNGPILIDDTLAPLLPAQYWTYQILGSPGTGMILQLQVGVPEPASMVLALLGAAALIGWTLGRRRKR